MLKVGEPKRKKAKKDVFTVNLYYDGIFTSCPMIYFQGKCKVLTNTNFDEMTYVHLFEILKRLVPNGFEKVYYFKSDAKLISIREIRNDELRKTRIKAELDSSDDDYHYSDDDLEEIENVGFHTEGDDSVVIKNITTQDPFLTKLFSARILFRGHVEFGVNEETPQVDRDDNQIDHIDVQYFKEIIEDPSMPLRKMRDDIRQKFMINMSVGQCKRAKQLALFDHEGGLIEHYAKLYQEWFVYPSGFHELEVRKGYQSYGVSLQHKASCKKDPQPKPEVEKKPPGGNKQVFVRQCASRGGGRSGRGDENDGSGSGVNDASGGGVNAGSGSGVTDGSGSGGRGGGRAGGSGRRGGGRANGSGKRGGGRAGRGSERGSRGGVFPSLSSCGILTAEQEYQLELDEQSFRECMEEQAREQAKIDDEQENVLDVDEAPEQETSDDRPTPKQGKSPPVDKGKAKATVEDRPAPQQAKSPAMDKGKTKASVKDGPAPKKKRGRPPSSVDGIRIYHKNHGRSERIANMKLNKPF
nr:chloramphenicol acetyltransferase-like domain-containing protein [Tanacetum cinerariifolium]